MHTEPRISPHTHQRAKEIFLAVRPLDVDARERELIRRALDEPEAAREARELLCALESAPEFLETSLQDRLPSTPAAPSVRRIGGFRILASLGRGGMGVVYLAEQDAPQRRVALKLLRREIDDVSLTARFRREIEVLGRIQHPGIARIYEAGVTMIDGAELPWYAMEYVEGHGIVEHARRENLGSAQRVRLIAEVCDAVHAAHEAGVVHRDLKPDNVLVDSNGRVRVLDFGVAAIVGRTTDLTTMKTATGELVGTVSYMSPEQASGGTEPIDARSDVYSLGVMLFELLTGDLPCTTRGQMLHEAVRAVREDEPTLLTSSRPELGRELAAVGAKTLEKAPERRYSTAAEMAKDLRRWLADEPVLARHQHAGARLLKLVHRHRVLFGSIGFALLALITGLIVALLALERARVAENSARVDASRTQRLSDLRGIEVLESHADDLFPPTPETLPAFEAWLAEAERIVGRRAVHEANLVALANSPNVGNSDDLEIARALQESLRRFTDPLHGELQRVRARASFARELSGRTVDAQADAWRAAIDRVASSKLYDGVELRPQVGLVPLGPDPLSGLEEFAHFGASGVVPVRARDGTLSFDEHSSLVFTLLPGGTFLQGADPGEPAVRSHEVGKRAVTLAPFFISKYEVTQAQWQRVTDSNPSYFAAGELVEGTRIDWLHPVEFVSWPTANRVFAQLDLELPTEAQFEYALRAGSCATWWWGEDLDCWPFARAFPILPDKELRQPGRWETHAPVGSYRPNALGLYDMAGNVQEWCRDPFKVRYLELPLRPGDGLVLAESPDGDKSIRGGNWSESVREARNAHRTDGLDDWHTSALGVRPVRRLR